MPLTNEEWEQVFTFKKNIHLEFSRKRIFSSLFNENGIPDNMRGTIWCRLLQIEHVKSAQNGQLYMKLVHMDNPDLELAIYND